MDDLECAPLTGVPDAAVAVPTPDGTTVVCTANSSGASCTVKVDDEEGAVPTPVFVREFDEVAEALVTPVPF